MFSNFTALFLYPKISRQLTKKRKLYFFCHAWSFGGAERVHIDILNLFKELNPICFITDRSKNEGFRKEFEAAADVINLGRWTEKTAYKNHLHKKIAKKINNEKAPIVLGCNSRFMYELIPFLEPHVKIVDIIHNFSDHNEGAEWYSIPYIPRLNQRVVVGKKIISQFKDLYKISGVSDQYLDRIEVIENKITINKTIPAKDFNSIVQIIFVARNSPEKRVNVMLRIAELCKEKNLPVTFKMIGNFESYTGKVPPNTEIVGQIHNKRTLNSHYETAHLLLLTSYREGCGLVVFEGMSFGVVPLATNVGELGDYISLEKKNGILVDNIEDEEKLANLFMKEIIHFIADRNELKLFSKNAFDTIANRFNESTFSDAYKSVVCEKSQ